MDNLDYKILDLLKENSRIQISDISRSIKLSIPAVSERIRKLDEAGIIEKYTIKINREKTNTIISLSSIVSLLGNSLKKFFNTTFLKLTDYIIGMILICFGLVMLFT